MLTKVVLLKPTEGAASNQKRAVLRKKKALADHLQLFWTMRAPNMHQEWLIRGKKIIMTLLLNKIIVKEL